MKETLKAYICEKCGGELKEKGEGRYLCPYCRVEYFKETTLPDELILDLHSANRARGLQRFEDALNEYDRIIKKHPKTSEAYWGATLSDYGIQYEDDSDDGRMVPTVNRFSPLPVSENKYYKKAIEYCKNDTEKERMESSAAEIERIRADIQETIGTQEPYDIFLCYKEAPVRGNALYTPEYRWANDLYIELSTLGYRVFFAKESLPTAKGDYEAHIFPALMSAKLMLILTTSVENVESAWVKNEWSRFIRFSKGNPAAGKRFKVIYRDFRPEELPRPLNNEQALDHDSNKWHESLLAVVKDTFRDEKKEAEEKRKREQAEQEARFAQMLEKESKQWSAERYGYIEKKLFDGFYIGYAKNDVPHGKGKYTYANGDVFEGYYADDKANGHGKITYKNGDVFEGEYKNGKKNGNGKMTYANGDVHEGEYKDGKRSGKGKMTFVDGDVFEGEYKDGKRSGNGKMLFKNGNVFEGYYIDDKANGHGKETYKDGGVFEGEYKDGKRNGKGKHTYKDGTLYEGEWKDGKRNGKGKMTFANGDVIEGEWKDNMPNGKGKHTYKDGDIFEGEYKDGKKNGKGKYTYKDGTSYEGEWVNGELKKEEKTDLQQDTPKSTEEIYKAPSKDNTPDSLPKVGEYIKFGKYKQSDKNASPEDIEWQVLDVKDGKALVISKHGLDSKEYNEALTSVTWETCTLRKWLNNDFINKAFSEKEKLLIKAVTVSADKNPNHRIINPGNATVDKVFLPSISEVNKYFTSSDARKCSPTKYAVINGVQHDFSSQTCSWWLRTPGNGLSIAASINCYGYVNDTNTYVNIDTHAVRPAMWIDLNSLILNTSEGTPDSKQYFCKLCGGKLTETEPGIYACPYCNTTCTAIELEKVTNKKPYFCNICGATLKAERDGYYSCNICKRKYSFTELEKSQGIRGQALDLVYIEKGLSEGFYKGYAKNDVPCGKGKMTYKNRDIYDGEWKDGKKHGKGKFTWADGEAYKGAWVNGKRSGKGKYVYKSGNTYEGEFNDGEKHGNGKFTWANGNIYEGEWVNGKRSGKGKYIYKDGNVYEGQFKEGKKDGNGKFTFKSGSAYEGQFKDDNFNGRGKFTYTNGEIYDGEWKDDKKNGKGKYIFKNGDVFEGEWQNGEQIGKGTITYTNGKTANGKMVNGKFKKTLF